MILYRKIKILWNSSFGCDLIVPLNDFSIAHRHAAWQISFQREHTRVVVNTTWWI